MREINRHLAESIKQEILSDNRQRYGSYEEAAGMARSIVAQARGQGGNASEMRSIFPGLGAPGASRPRRLPGAMGAGEYTGFFYGIGVAVLAAMIWPHARQGLRSLVVQLVEGGMEIADRTRSAVARTREEIEDIVAEARFKNLQDYFSCNPGEMEEVNKPGAGKRLFH
ncbi:MAG: hypothetical protein BWY80_00913 [Firmicutes bacterium ADurb.Bin456]|nr:MAG: hypothetical protein BWY80_00913 [Firmicutes bacterium ADurb.Bin456]